MTVTQSSDSPSGIGNGEGSLPGARRPHSVSRVVFVLRTPVGGLFRHVCDLAALLRKRGVEAGLVCGDFDPPHLPRIRGPLDEVFRLGVVSVAMPATFGPRDLSALSATWRFLRRVRPDIVHGHGAKGGVYARIASRIAGIPALYTPHGGSLHYQGTARGKAVYFPIERLLLRLSSALVFESEFARDRFCEFVARPACLSRVVRNGVADEEFDRPSAAPDADFTFVGDLRMPKGVDVLIEACALLAREGWRFRMAIYGRGVDEKRLRVLAKERRLDGIVAWFPPLYPGRIAMARGRAVVLPSRSESLPYVVLEAAAMAIPVIATKVGGIPEIFGPILAQHLVPPSDAAALAGAMRAALADPMSHVLRAMHLQARVRAQFSEAAMVDQIAALYGAVATEAQERAAAS